MKLDSAIHKALLVGAFTPFVAAAQGVTGSGEGWDRWSATTASAAYPAAVTDPGYATPADPRGEPLPVQAQWSGDSWGGDQWGSAVTTLPNDGYTSVPPAYDSGTYPHQTMPPAGYTGSASHADDPYTTGYAPLQGQGGYAPPPPAGQAPGYGGYAGGEGGQSQPHYPGAGYGGDFGGTPSAYPSAGGYAPQPSYPSAPAAPYSQAPQSSGYGTAPAAGYGDNWSGAAAPGTSYPAAGYPSGAYSAPAAPVYPESSYPQSSYPDSTYQGGDSWGSVAQPVGGGYDYQGGYQDPYQGGYAPPPQATDNPWAGAAAGYTREPVEDFREQRRRDNPWAFERPDPAREAERRRWREQPSRPWAREGDERFDQAPAGPTYDPYGGQGYGGQGYGAPGNEYGYPGYGRGDGYYYPGGGYDPWSSWGRGLPGGNWGGWPSMPWNW